MTYRVRVQHANFTVEFSPRFPERAQAEAWRPEGLRADGVTLTILRRSTRERATVR